MKIEKTARIKFYEQLKEYPYHLYVSNKHIRNFNSKDEALDEARRLGAKRAFVETHHKEVKL